MKNTDIKLATKNVVPGLLCYLNATWNFRQNVICTTALWHIVSIKQNGQGTRRLRSHFVSAGDKNPPQSLRNSCEAPLSVVPKAGP